MIIKYRRIIAWVLIALLLAGTAMVVYSFAKSVPFWSTRGLALIIASAVGTYVLKKKIKEAEEMERDKKDKE